MTKAELIERVYKENRPRRLSKVAIAEMIDAAFGAIARGVEKDGKFTYPGFGAFNRRQISPRMGRNPKTGEPLKIQASTTIRFQPAPKLKDSLR